MASPSVVQGLIPKETVNLSVPDPVQTQHLSLPLYQGCGFNDQYKAWQIMIGSGLMLWNLELPNPQAIVLTLNECSMNISPTPPKSNNPYTIQVNGASGYTLVRAFDDHLDNFHDVTFTITSQWLHTGSNSIQIQLDADARSKISFKAITVQGLNT